MAGSVGSDAFVKLVEKVSRNLGDFLMLLLLLVCLPCFLLRLLRCLFRVMLSEVKWGWLHQPLVKGQSCQHTYIDIGMEFVFFGHGIAAALQISQNLHKDPLSARCLMGAQKVLNNMFDPL